MNGTELNDIGKESSLLLWEWRGLDCAVLEQTATGTQGASVQSQGVQDRGGVNEDVSVPSHAGVGHRMALRALIMSNYVFLFNYELCINF